MVCVVPAGENLVVPEEKRLRMVPECSGLGPQCWRSWCRRGQGGKRLRGPFDMGLGEEGRFV